LRRQLKIGGRLIIPIGELGGTQELVKVVRDGDDAQRTDGQRRETPLRRMRRGLDGLVPRKGGGKTIPVWA
jgi:protein-L-isoaspartate O-methyltransferase